MVIFGANHTAERFLDGDRLTAHFPGPGAYDYASRSPAAEVAPVPRRYAGKTLEDGCVRPDGSELLFRGRDSWVRGVDGPKVCHRGYVQYYSSSYVPGTYHTAVSTVATSCLFPSSRRSVDSPVELTV